MIFNVARLLRVDGYQIKVATIHYPETPVREEMDGVEVIRARYAPERFEVMGSEGGLIDDIRSSLLCKLLVLPMLFSLAWATLKEARRVDMLLVQWIPTAVLALPAKLLFRKPMIFHSRTYPDTFFWRAIYHFLLPFADGVIYNSSDNRRLTEKIYAHPNSVVIGSGINLEQFSRPAGARNGGNTWKLVTVARLVEFKGLEFAVRTVAELKARGRKVHLNIVGEGPLRSKLEALCRELDVTDEVALSGVLPHDKVPEALWAADLFLIPSIVDSVGRTEGFGAVILEAMAAGLPVIASAVGGITDIIDGENGLLVPEKDPPALADAVETMLSDPAVGQAFADRGLSFVAVNYADRVLREKYSEFFSALV